jgi:hypothetical protein
MVKTKAAALLLVLALGGCAPTPDRSAEYMDPPSPEKQLDRTLAASDKGPTQWSPAVTVPLYPVILVVDTGIKFVGATYRWIAAFFGGGDDRPDVPERLERQAEKIPKN